MICSTILSRATAANLHCDPEWARFTVAWRMYALFGTDEDVMVYVQSSFPIELLRVRFHLPRLFMSSMRSMLNVVLERPGMLGDCIFSGGEFERALRRTANDLSDQMEDAAPIDLTADSPPLTPRYAPLDSTCTTPTYHAA